MTPSRRDTRTGHPLYAVAFLALACFLIGFLALRILSPFLAAIAWALVLVVVFHRPWRSLRRRLPGRRHLTAALMSVVIGLLVLVPVGLFAGLLTSQAVDAANRMIEELKNEHVTSLADFVAIPKVESLLEQAQRQLGVSSEDFAKLTSAFADRASTFLTASSKRLILGVFDQVLTFFTTLFLLFFFFRDGETMGTAAIGLLPIGEAERVALVQSVRRMILAIFRGSLLCSLIQGATGGLGWWLAGLGSPALAGAAMSFLSLLPIGGTALVWIPGSIWAWYAGTHGAAIFIFLWGLIVTTIVTDNFLRPLLIGSSDDLSTLAVFLGVFGGLTAFGLLGIFIGPVTLVLATALIDILCEQARRSIAGAPTPGDEGTVATP
jgi:predicted PurR-regulated permease PerM